MKSRSVFASENCGSHFSEILKVTGVMKCPNLRGSYEITLTIKSSCSPHFDAPNDVPFENGMHEE